MVLLEFSIAPLEKGDSDAGWWVKGSEFLGRRVRRAVYVRLAK